MQFLSRVVLAFLVFGCALSVTGALELYGAALFPQEEKDVTPGALLDQVFTRAGFRYGPQAWRPSYDPLGISPAQEVIGNETWYLMFVDLNSTPVSGNPNVKQLGAVKVTYNFTSLSGRAVFHFYGLTTGTAPTRTNRQVGSKNCSYMVTGTAAAGVSMPAAALLPFAESHEYKVAVANVQPGDSENLSAKTVTFKFNQPGAGQGALHITPNLSKPMGGNTETTEQHGTFYVTATGNDPGNDLIVLVAVDRPQPDGFALRLRSQFVRTN